MPYLGITLTSRLSNLYKENFVPLLTETQKDTAKMGKLYLSGAERLEVFKISILTKILYVFRMLPIQIPLAFFKTIQKTISTFLWTRGKSRCNHDTLQKHRRAGGMGVPDLCDYYTAILLDQIRFWFIKSNLKPWCTLEQATVSLGSLQSLFTS